MLIIFQKIHCKIRIFFNFIYGIFFHPFKNIFLKVRKNYLLMTEIAIWKLKKFQKRWNLAHFQNSEIFFTNLWRIISVFSEFDECNSKDMEIISFNYGRKFRKAGNLVFSFLNFEIITAFKESGIIFPTFRNLFYKYGKENFLIRKCSCRLFEILFTDIWKKIPYFRNLITTQFA